MEEEGGSDLGVMGHADILFFQVYVISQLGQKSQQPEKFSKFSLLKPG